MTKSMNAIAAETDRDARPRVVRSIQGRTGAALASAAAVALLSTGCSDARAPNEANFRKAIEPVVADAFCQRIDATRLVAGDAQDDKPFPVVISAQPPEFDPGRIGRGLLEDAAARGLMTRTSETVVAKRENYDEAPTSQRALRFEPTEQGRDHVRSIETKLRNGGTKEVAAICPARGELVDVVRWTEPADAFGQRLTQVTYVMRGVDPIGGATPADLRALAPVERTVTLTLANDGWRVAS